MGTFSDSRGFVTPLSSGQEFVVSKRGRGGGISCGFCGFLDPP